MLLIDRRPEVAQHEKRCKESVMVFLSSLNCLASPDGASSLNLAEENIKRTLVTLRRALQKADTRA